jgi:hypothetical protein
MEWFRGLVRKKSSVKRSSVPVQKRKSSGSKRDPRVVFVKGQAKAAHPKQTGSGYYYVRKDSNGKVHKISVVGRTYSRQEAQKKIRKTK